MKYCPVGLAVRVPFSRERGRGTGATAPPGVLFSQDSGNGRSFRPAIPDADL